MFIRKWKYEMNLDNARLQGMRAGSAEAVSVYHDVVKNLEAENAELKKALEETMHEVSDLKESHIEVAMEMVGDALRQRSKETIEIFAQEVARLQRMADVSFYIKKDTDHSSWLCDQTFAIKQLAEKMGIWGPIYAQAVELYDFRNSGREGYTLKDGKIVKVEEETQEQAQQETAVEETETPSECCEEAVEETAVECPFCDDAQPGDCCQENNGMIHETV